MKATARRDDVDEEGYRQRTAEQKVSILRQVLVDKQPISKVCEEHGMSPTLYYEWQRQFFENGTAAFSEGQGRRSPAA